MIPEAELGRPLHRRSARHHGQLVTASLTRLHVDWPADQINAMMSTPIHATARAWAPDLRLRGSIWPHEAVAADPEHDPADPGTGIGPTERMSRRSLVSKGDGSLLSRGQSDGQNTSLAVPQGKSCGLLLHLGLERSVSLLLQITPDSLRAPFECRDFESKSRTAEGGDDDDPPARVRRRTA